MQQTYKAIWVLGKPRLSFFITLSAVFSYFVGDQAFDTSTFFYLIFGGFSISAGASAFNQIFEKKQDALMKRTQNRPLVTGIITEKTAYIVASIYTFIGACLLYRLPFLVFFFGILSWFLYAFVYTPMKKYSALAVFVGAIPGAIPAILGYVSNTGHFGLEAGIVFFVQFIWQFPHFWSIAWVMHEDYQKAGYDLLPFEGGKNKINSQMILVYTFFVIPSSLLFWIFPQNATLLSNAGAILVLLLGLFFLYFAFALHKNQKNAKYLMFYSFIYLPLVQLIYLLSRQINL